MPYDSNIEADLSARVVLLLHGLLKNGGKFWCFVAVKPSRFEAFRTAYRSGKLDLSDFDAFGEIEQAGEGETPPEPMLRALATKYGMAPDGLRAPFDPEAAVRAKIAEAKQVVKKPSNS